MKKLIGKNKVLLFFIIVALVQPIIIKPGNPFQYDWSWPIFDMKQFWNGLLGDSSFGLFSALSKNISAVFGLFGLIHFPPSIFLRLFIFFVHFIAGYGFYKFIRSRVKSEIVAIVSGLAYAFSPYIFIRTIVGFVWSMVAYAVLPIFLLKFWQTKKKILDYLIIGFLFSLIFGQTQAGLLTLFIITIYTAIGLLGRLLRRKRTSRNDGERLEIGAVKNYFLALILLLLFTLPWAVTMFFHKTSSEIVTGGAVTTLERMSTLLHSYRNMLMLSDHEITTPFFYPFSHNTLVMIGFTIVWFVALCALFNKKNRQLVLTFFISSLMVIPFYKGPVGHFGSFYIWFYNHIPQVMIFRETYHFEFLFAIALCVLFAFGLDVLWTSIDHNRIFNLKFKIFSFESEPEGLSLRVEDNKFKMINSDNVKNSTGTGSQIKSGMTTQVIRTGLKSKILNPKSQVLIKTGLKTLFAGSALFIVAPYLTFDYAGYSPVRQIPADYNELYNYFRDNKDVCHKIYYPPGLDFVYFKGDNLPGASNSDVIAYYLGIPYVTGGTSILNTPSPAMFYQNELVSQFYEENDNGEFVNLLNEGGVDCIVARQDMDTKYDQAMNLKFEKDPTITKHWNQNDWKAMAQSKKGLVEYKNFGTNIFVFKISKSEFQISNEIPNPNDKMLKTGKAAKEQFVSTDNRQLTTYNLPLTDWANVNSYYKNGWSRGRYDFWRKHLFTQLRQDFIYTDKGDSTLTEKVDQKGDYEVWVRCLVGGTAGSWQLAVGSSSQPTADGKPLTFIKNLGEEKFVWKKLGDVKLSGQTNIEIKNISGENAIADLVLVPK